MSTGHWHITPVNGYDISALEAWLAKNASCGKKFSFTIALFTYFEPIEPVQLQIHLEPIRGKVEEDPELEGMVLSMSFSLSDQDPQIARLLGLAGQLNASGLARLGDYGEDLAGNPAYQK